MINIISEALTHISVQDGVFKPDKGSISLAQASMQLTGSYLEIGTGSGFVAIVLALQGKEVTACDVSAPSVESAKKNALAAGVTIPLFVSDLFSAVQGTYDVIVFNPPTNANESDADRLRKNRIKEQIPAFVWKPLSTVFQAMNAANRRKFLRSFIDQSKQYLKPGGTLLMNVIEPDWDFFRKMDGKNMQVTKVNTSPGCIVVKLTQHA